MYAQGKCKQGVFKRPSEYNKNLPLVSVKVRKGEGGGFTSSPLVGGLCASKNLGRAKTLEGEGSRA